jgi:hypothetical protein
LLTASQAPWAARTREILRTDAPAVVDDADECRL